MFESILTISITGLLAGFIFAMPIAGPTSILITSNALKGRLRYCRLVSMGAAVVDFCLAFIAVFGLTKLYTLLTPVIPYMFAAGSVFFLFLGYKNFRTKIDIEHLEDKSHLVDRIKKKEKGAFYTGIMINFLNPTLFLTAFTSSFFVITLIASLGFSTGGLATKIGENAKEINKIQGTNIDTSQVIIFGKYDKFLWPKTKVHDAKVTKFPSQFHVAISICYAFFLSAGSFLWCFLLSFLIVRFRQLINIKVLSAVIKILGVVLCLIGIYFGYMTVIKLL
jgi:threonine/homoserine/homoserine lactone efflux protein